MILGIMIDPTNTFIISTISFFLIIIRFWFLIFSEAKPKVIDIFYFLLVNGLFCVFATALFLSYISSGLT